MIALGPEVLEDCFIPQMEEYIKSTIEKIDMTDEEQMASEASFNKRDAGFYENQKKKVILNLMWGTLLAAGKTLLSYYSKNVRKIARKTVLVDQNRSTIKIKQETGTENELDKTMTIEDSTIIDSSGKICISKVYDFLYDQFGSGLSILYSDPSRFKHKQSKKTFAKDHRHRQYNSSLKRYTNFHKSLNRNPYECVGRMRIRTLGKKNVNEVDKTSSFFNVKHEMDEQPFAQSDLKPYCEEKNNYQPRPTSSTSSDADFNYLAGCGLPTDIFEPIISQSNQTLNNPQIFQRTDMKSKETEETETCISLSPNVVQSFEIVTTVTSLNQPRSEANAARSHTTVSNIRCRQIAFAFGTSQWPREKLKRKRFTPSLVVRYQDNMKEGIIVKGHHLLPRVVVGKRMGTPRGITTSGETAVYSCSLMSNV